MSLPLGLSSRTRRSAPDRSAGRRQFLLARSLEQCEDRVLLASLLGSAQSFAILGGSTVTNTGATLISGNLGVSPGSAVTGFPPGIVTGGSIHAADAVAAAAQADALIAYNTIAGLAPGTNLSGQDLGGMTLLPGVYTFNTSAQLTGTLTLDAQGDPNALFEFRIGSTLTTASASAVNLINGASAANVYFQVGSSATLGTGTAFNGNIIALTSVTMTTGSGVAHGSVLALNGAVTLDTVDASILQSNISIVKTADVPSISAGDTAAFTITVNNSGVGAATSVVVTDVLPPGVPWTTSTPGASIVAGVLTDNLGTMDPGVSAVIHVSGVTTVANIGTITDTASVMSDNQGPLTSTAIITVNIPPDLVFTKTADVATINTGDTAAFTITVQNAGLATAHNVVVTDPLPVGVPWATTTPGATIVAGTLTDTIGDLLPGASVVIHVSGLTTTATPGTLPDTANVTSSNNVPVSLNASATITVNSPHLTIVKSADQATISAGDTAAFTISVSNAGPGLARGVIISDLLPAGFNWVTTTPFAVISGGGALSYDAGTLAVGASVVIHFHAATISSPTSSFFIMNTANVNSTNNNPPELSSSATISIQQPDLAIVKTADRATINAGETAGFSITVTNDREGVAHGVVVTDPLPAGVSWTTSTAGASIVSGTLIDIIGDMAFGSVVIHVSGLTSAANTSPLTDMGTLPNTASVTSSNDFRGTLTSSSTITVVAPDLVVTKTPDATPIQVGNTAGFLITVTNVGPGTALGFQLTDILPAGVTWASLSGPAFFNGHVMTTPGIPTLASGASFTIHITGATTATGALTNVVTVSANNESSANLANNTARATIIVNPIAPPVSVRSLIRVGVHNQPTQFILTFSGPLDPAQAANLIHYQLVQVGAGGQAISAPIPLGAAVYNPFAHTVTLLPVHLVNVHFRYRLTIAGLTDAAGKPIIGSNGIAGAPFVATFGMNVWTNGIIFGLQVPGPPPLMFLRKIASTAISAKPALMS